MRARFRSTLAHAAPLWSPLRQLVAVLLWFVREQLVTVVAAVMLSSGCAMWSRPLGLIVGALSLVAVEIKTGVDWRARAG